MFAGFSRTYAVIALASATALGFIVVEPSAVASETVDIQVEIIGGCEGNTYGVTYAPSLAWSIDNALSAGDGFPQRTEIDLYIDEGQDAECNPIYGHVEFTESGFEDWSGDVEPNIETTFDCDGFAPGQSGLAFTCGGGAFHPDAIGVSVEALAGTQLGTFTNTITLTLFAD